MNFIFQEQFTNYKKNKLNIIEFFDTLEKKEEYIEIFNYIISNNKRDSSDFRFFLYYVCKIKKIEIFENLFNIIIENNYIEISTIKFFIEYSKYTTKKKDLEIILNHIRNIDLKDINKVINFIEHKINSIVNLENF